MGGQIVNFLVVGLDLWCEVHSLATVATPPSCAAAGTYLYARESIDEENCASDLRIVYCRSAAGVLTTPDVAAAESSQPNIIVFLVDDMGVMDTSVPFSNG